MGDVIALRRATAVRSAGSWPTDDAVCSVTLDFDQRHRRRIRLTDDDGHPFLLDLAAATRLCDGDGLCMADGSWMLVVAAAEPVADIRAKPNRLLTRIAWHLGNRHTPVEIRPNGSLRIRQDHVLVAMVEGLGGTVALGEGPFSPEGGAYDHGGGHAHGDGHGHGHDGHGHGHGHPQQDHHHHGHGHDDGIDDR